MTWEASGLGVRHFCRQQGLAVGTFDQRHKKLAGELSVGANPLLVTPDALSVTARPDGEPVALAPSVTTDPPSSSRDRVTLSLAAVRIDLTGTHTSRLVRFVLGQLGGGRRRTPPWATCSCSLAETARRSIECSGISPVSRSGTSGLNADTSRRRRHSRSVASHPPNSMRGSKESRFRRANQLVPWQLHA